MRVPGTKDLVLLALAVRVSGKPVKYESSRVSSVVQGDAQCFAVLCHAIICKSL